PAFNTPEAAAVVDRLAKATASGGINKISWTGRWVEPNGAFSSGTVGMMHAHSSAYFFVKGQGRWINRDSLGVAQAPGNWSTPTNHGFAISKSSKNPELAFALIKLMTGNKWATKFATTRRILTANLVADKACLESLKDEDPVAHAVLQTQLEHTDRMTGNWPLANDAEIKDAFWPELQNGLLGRKAGSPALRRSTRRAILIWAFLAPSLLIFLLYRILPLLWNVVLSFEAWSPLKPAVFIGLDNYQEMLFDDDVFWQSLWNTFGIIASAPIGIAIALGLALLVHSNIRGREV